MEGIALKIFNTLEYSGWFAPVVWPEPFLRYIRLIESSIRSLVKGPFFFESVKPAIQGGLPPMN